MNRKKLARYKRKLKNKLQSRKEIRVSDHAIVQYLSRVKGYDIDSIKDEILTEDIKIMMDTLGGSGKFPNKNFRVVLKDNVVVTVIN